MKDKPTINSTSTRLVGNHQPIHERYERVITQKAKKLEEERLKIK